MPKVHGLTFKQKKFIQEYVKTNGNGTQSALRVYDTNKKSVAKVIAHDTLRKPLVQEELQKILLKNELRLDKVADNIASIAVATPTKGYTGADVLEANKTLLKLHGVLTDRKVSTTYNMNIDYAKLSQHELLELRSKKLQETNSILAEE